MTRKGVAWLASVQNEVACINTTLDNGGKAWVTIDGERMPIHEAEELDHTLIVYLVGSEHEGEAIQPSDILPGGRGVWNQIKLED